MSTKIDTPYHPVPHRESKRRLEVYRAALSECDPELQVLLNMRACEMAADILMKNAFVKSPDVALEYAEITLDERIFEFMEPA